MANKEPYKPWMRSLLNRMKELYNKPDAKTIAEALPEVGSGGEVTAAAVVSATGEMNETQASATRTNIGAASLSEQAMLITRVTNAEGIEVPVLASDATITPQMNHIYKCGTLTSLTVTDPPATGEYTIVFTSGATPTVCSFDDIRWPNDEAPSIEANTEYEIIVKDNRGVCSQPGWPVEVNTP